MARGAVDDADLARHGAVVQQTQVVPELVRHDDRKLRGAQAVGDRENKNTILEQLFLSISFHDFV